MMIKLLYNRDILMWSYHLGEEMLDFQKRYLDPTVSMHQKLFLITLLMDREEYDRINQILWSKDVEAVTLILNILLMRHEQQTKQGWTYTV